MLASPTDPTYRRLRHTGGALAHSLSAAAWRDSLDVRRADAVVAPSLRVGLAVLLVLVGGGLFDQVQLAGFAALGALSSAFGRHEPYRRLAGKAACAGAGVVAYVALGAATGATGIPMWIQTAMLAAAAGIAFWLLAAFRIIGPGALILIFAAAGAAGFADTAADIGAAVTAAAIGATVGWAVAMAPALYHPHGPARVAVARALAAVSALETDGEEAVAPARAAIARGREVVALGARHPHTHELLALLDAAEAVVDTGSHDTVRARRDDFARLESELRKIRRDIAIPRVDAADSRLPERPESFLRTGVRDLRDRAIVVGAGRVVAGALLAGWIALAAGLQHPLWATMGAMAALQGANYGHTVQRAIQRLIGNVAGALLAAALLAAALGYWPLVVVIVVLQTTAELYVTRNYALASIAVTAMSLLLTGLGEPIGPDIAISRVGDTLIGVVVGVIVAALTIARGDRHHLLARP
ncbi:FUSC family protein [Rhodococcus phenolicus]|uniref:FUSC family protein n=1 Tax=Rhodococcus phenolicus TaxID=263849 RepID=UPI0008312958|nr:FUSC family protein [Rhodococcus phenolicus]